MTQAVTAKAPLLILFTRIVVAALSSPGLDEMGVAFWLFVLVTYLYRERESYNITESYNQQQLARIEDRGRKEVNCLLLHIIYHDMT